MKPTSGAVALARGDLVAAHEHLLVALRSRMSHGYLGRACDTVNAIAVRCALGGDPLTAARLFGAAQATRANLRATPGIYGPYWLDRQARLRRVLGDGAFDAAYSEGGELALEEAAALALGVEHPDLGADSLRFGTTGAPAPRRPDQAPDPHPA